MGVDIANAALAAGHAVVATARNANTVIAALGQEDDRLAVSSTSPTPATPKQPSRLPSTASDASTC
jgi:hypothetical protein